MVGLCVREYAKRLNLDMSADRCMEEYMLNFNAPIHIRLC